MNQKDSMHHIITNYSMSPNDLWNQHVASNMKETHVHAVRLYPQDNLFNKCGLYGRKYTLPVL